MQESGGALVVVLDGVVHGTTVVPHEHVAACPAVPVNIFRARGQLVDVFQDRRALGFVHVGKSLGEERIDVQRLAARFRVCAHHGMRHRRGYLGYRQRIGGRFAIALRGGLAAVLRLEIFEEMLHAGRKLLIGRIHIAEHRISTPFRHLERVEQGHRWRAFGVGDIGMPEVVAGSRLAGAILQHQELGEVGKSPTAIEWMGFHGAEVPGEGDLRGRRQGLTANDQHDVLEERVADEIHRCGVQRLRQIHAADLRAQRNAQLPYFQHAAHTFRCRSATVYSSDRCPVPGAQRSFRNSTTGMTASIHPFDAVLGAEVRGIDLSRPVGSDSVAVVRAAYEEHSVLLFRDQELTAEQQIDFSRRFGKLEIHVLGQWRHPEHPEILIVSNVKDKDRHVGVPHAGRYWHTDLSYMVAPSRGSLLYAIEIPEQNGRALGDTRFTSTVAAYEALPEESKDRIADLSATFSLAHHRSKLMADGASEDRLTADQEAKVPVAVHRIVQEHPVTGRKCLFVNEGHTVEILGLPEKEGRELLEMLCRHATSPEFLYLHRWRVGDLLMWDNVATQHIAEFNYALPERRYLHRTTLEGVALA